MKPLEEIRNTRPCSIKEKEIIQANIIIHSSSFLIKRHNNSALHLKIYDVPNIDENTADNYWKKAGGIFFGQYFQRLNLCSIERFNEIE